MRENTASVDPGGAGSVSPRGPGGSAQGVLRAARVPSPCRRPRAGRKLPGACLLFILARRCCSAAGACRPKFNARMTPPSSPCARRLLQARDCAMELRCEYSCVSVWICFVWSTAAEGRDLSFLWRGPQRALRGRSFCCSATIRARRCPLALLWSPAQIWWGDCRRSAVGVRFSLLPLRILTKKRAAAWKARWFCFCISRARSGDTVFSFISFLSWKTVCQVLSHHDSFLAWSETPLPAKRKTALTVGLWRGIYDQVSFYIHLAQLYGYKQMTVIRWAGCLKFSWNSSTVLFLAPGIWLV